MKSFMKWCGGKQRLVSQLLSHVPETYGTYFEPFIGAGSLYLALKPSKAYIGDLNEELIETYKGIQRDPQKVVDLLKSYPNDKEAFLKIRDASYSSSEERAARMLYVNRAGFNGLYRVNKKGKCNVAYGKRKSLDYNFENILEVGDFLKNGTDTKILHGDYKQFLPLVSSGDFIYLDPPYYGTFASYTSTPFTNEDLQHLSDFVDQCVAKGAKVLISNSNAPKVLETFQKYTIVPVKLKWVVGGKNQSPKEDNEILIRTW